jgi:outer membrane protein insertion porin family
MKKLIPIFSEGTVDPDLVEEGRRNLIDFFQSKGYFDAKVTTNLQNQASNVELFYSVDRGSRHRVETVDFQGNQHFDKDVLIRQVAVKPHRTVLLSRGKFSDKLLRQSVAGITAFYKNLGYEEVKVDTDVVDREPKVYITFQVTEGSQTLVDKLTMEGNSRIPTSALSPKGGLRLKPAAAEFQKLLDHRGIVLNFVTGALVHLQLARAHAMAGDTAKAKTAYQHFFDLWKDADSDIPVRSQARREYANLR